MADLPVEGLSVYRLLPGLSDYQVLSLNSSDSQRLMRWQRTGAEADRPARLRAEWMGERRWPKGDFPSGYPGAPVLGRRVLDRFGDGLLASGSLVPVDIEEAKGDEYHLLLVEEVVDCLDLRRSSKPKKASGEVKKGCSGPTPCRPVCRPSVCRSSPVPSSGTDGRSSG